MFFVLLFTLLLLKNRVSVQYNGQKIAPAFDDAGAFLN